MELTPNPDILLTLAQSANKGKGKSHPYCVGFAAESTKLEEHADEKRKRKGVPLIVGNIGPDTFGSDLNQLLLIHDRGTKKLAKAPKLQLARQLIQFVATQL
jgi:phosphopantothenoylcysteine decarboxylase/phosphopantothenate--cysteine ligase